MFKSFRRKFKRFKRSCKILWYWYRHRTSIGEGDNSSLVPELGNGFGMTVRMRGAIIEVIYFGGHRGPKNPPVGIIKIVPVSYNHGVAIEYFSLDGELQSRAIVDYNHLYRIAAYQSERAIN